jgi:hypothetical protein
MWKLLRPYPRWIKASHAPIAPDQLEEYLKPLGISQYQVFKDISITVRCILA